MVRSNNPVIRKLRKMVEVWGREEMVRWDFEKVARVVGLVSLVVAFLDSRDARQAR